MILKFPDLDTLRLALTSGVVPPAVCQAAAVAGSDDQGQVWVEPAAPLPRAAQSDLRRLGVQSGNNSGAGETFPVSCWPEILPLRPDADPLDRLGQTPILFETPSQEALGRLVVEILRLGNDRQGFRWLDGAGGAGRGLLRVVGPPYYSLLRAVDRDGDDGPRAYRERAPRLWIEVGWTHPLADLLKPPAGKWLLLSPPRGRTLIDDAPFRDVYEVMEFALPDVPSEWAEGRLANKVRAPLTLTAGGSADSPELWVLRDNAVAELNRFVQNADDQMLHRLAFAVGEKEGWAVVVLRVRPSKLPPPELVLKAEAYKTYLKLPNLFLPAGRLLHPPLRRDVVRKLLAGDPAQVVWLAPLEGNAFRPESLSEDAFRPLIDWVDYVLDHDKDSLQAWVQAAQFDFEAFVCDEDAEAKPKKPPAPKRGRKKHDGGDEESPAGAPFEYVDKTCRPKHKPAAEPEAFAVEKVEPTESQRRLRELEERFTAAEGGLDAPERRALWPALADLNHALGQAEEAGVCRMHALWGQEIASEEAAWEWFRDEAASVPSRPKVGSWAAPLSDAIGPAREIAIEALNRLLALTEPAAADLRTLAAYVLWSMRREWTPKAILKRLDSVQRFLEGHEKVLPVRAVWLAWTALARGDVLALARARDRLLERLYQDGLRPEQDLPAFLRFTGGAAGGRMRGVGRWLRGLAEKAREWIARQGADPLAQGAAPGTGDYSDLIFAFGLARLGDRDGAQALTARAKAGLAERDDAHMLLFKGFEHRIRQALEGKPHGGPLPAELMEYLDHLRKGRRPGEVPGLGYVVDALRRISRVLEPHELVDPYLHALLTDEASRGRAELSALADRDELAGRVDALLRKTPKRPLGHRARTPIYYSALDAAPRAGEAFARRMLTEAVENFDALIGRRDPHDLGNLLLLLERALFVAAHFDSAEHTRALTPRFVTLLRALHGGPGLRDFDRLAGQCFRGLRKLGQRDEVDQLLAQTAEVASAGRTPAEVDDAALCSLLEVAGGWLHFGRDRQAEPVLNAARALLLANTLHYQRQTALACAYAAAAGRTPAEEAKKRLAELLECLGNVRDPLTTHPWYSQVQLRVIEAVVTAAAGDDFTLGADARRWLDDDEYLVRRRVHADYRAAAAQV